MFSPTGFSLNIFKQRYAFTENETWEEACARVARQMALAESSEKMKTYETKFQDILSKNLFVPGGRIWYQSGRNNPQLLNCFVLSSNLDSREGWGNIANEMIVTSMTGGGCGIEFSDVRPNGAIIHGQTGLCPGPVALMELIDGCAKPVTSGGQRRVALMFSLDIQHPDVLEFLDAKLEKGKLTHANVSLRSRITSEFVTAIKKGTDIELSWKGQYKKSIPARTLWDRIVKNTYDSAEPGFLNWELVAKENNIYYIEDLVSTNPCVTGEMLVTTPNGLKSVNSLINIPFKCIQNGKEYNSSGFWKTGTRPVYKVTTSHGYQFRLTEDHKIKMSDGSFLNLSDIEIGDNIVLNNSRRLIPEFNKNEFDLGWIVGEVVGDGCYNPNKDYYGCVKFWGNTSEYLCKKAFDIINNIETTYNQAKEPKLPKFDFKNKTYTLSSKKIDMLCEKYLNINKNVLPELEQAPLSVVAGFIQGIFDADGCVGGDPKDKGIYLQLSQSNLSSLQSVQKMLLQFGIISRIQTLREPHYKNMPDGKGGLKEYWCKQEYRLDIGRDSINIFAKYINFSDPDKRKKLTNVLLLRSKQSYKEKFETQITEIVFDGIEDVYDCNVDEINSFDINGVVVHNCGELALSSMDCCCLGHLVLPRFVSEDKTIDWPYLATTITTAVRFLDDVLSVNSYPLAAMKEKSHRLRRIGLGTTGLADMLALMGYRYGSADANKFIDKLFRFISKIAYEASIMLAIEKGPFPACVPEKHIESGYIKRMTPKIRSLILEHGIRNCAILTIAPTGTVSILSDNCSSGIEPMFAPAYERRFWKNKQREVELVFHPLFSRFMEEGKDTSHFVGARDLSIRDHLEVQKIVQNHIDNAVSKTINVAENCSIEEVSKLWLEYLPYLKGATFYRENTRGYVDTEGNVLEPPLVALDLEEAKSRFSSKALKGSEVHCANGKCEL